MNSVWLLSENQSLFLMPVKKLRTSLGGKGKRTAQLLTSERAAIIWVARSIAVLVEGLWALSRWLQGKRS